MSPSPSPRRPRLRTALWLRTDAAADAVQRACASVPQVSIESAQDGYVHLVYDVDRWQTEDTAQSHALLLDTLRSLLTMSGVRHELAIGSMLEPLPLPLPDGLRVVLADDQAGETDSLAEHLRQRGHEVRVADGGEQALRLALAARPDAMVLDLGMPDVDGYAVLNTLAAMGQADGIAFVALTGRDAGGVVSRGFDAHIRKPALPSEVERRVRHLVARKRALAAG